jgi:hypothetical protein
MQPNAARADQLKMTADRTVMAIETGMAARRQAFTIRVSLSLNMETQCFAVPLGSAPDGSPHIRRL